MTQTISTRNSLTKPGTTGKILYCFASFAQNLVQDELKSKRNVFFSFNREFLTLGLEWCHFKRKVFSQYEYKYVLKSKLYNVIQIAMLELICNADFNFDGVYTRSYCAEIKKSY